MSGENKVDNIDGKKIKIEDNHVKLISNGSTCRNSIVDCFINKCMEFYTKQVDYKSVRDYNTFTNTGKMV